jgi:D-glycero-alpha-D-manno-heptose-7-phosphate kinase
MIISQTPVRISFFGGGTDYPVYFRKHGGATLTATVNHYTLVTVHRLSQFSPNRLRVHYSKVESVDELDQIEHPSARECLRFMGIDHGIEIHYVSDLPARTGLGSSSSATVGLLLALHAFKGRMVSRAQVAAEAVHVEQELIKERVGCQDQYACALGGFQHLEFLPDGSVRNRLMVLPAARLRALQDRLLLLYTGVQRFSDGVLDEQLERTATGANTSQLHNLKNVFQQAFEALVSDDGLAEFGALLHEGWIIKRTLSSKISNPNIDAAYEQARKAGAHGGKLLGAGGGGFLLLFVEPDRREGVKLALPEFREAPFAFEDLGSQIIFYRM